MTETDDLFSKIEKVIDEHYGLLIPKLVGGVIGSILGSGLAYCIYKIWVQS